MKIWNMIKKYGAAVGAGVVAFLGLSESAHATFTDPASDIETALAGAGSGASSTFVTLLTIVASAALVGVILFAIRKGIRPR